MRKLIALSAALIGAFLVLGAPVGAITNGQLDGNRHPAVVLIEMDVDGTPTFRCSGTLVAPTFVLTAGHCAGEPGEFSAMRVFAEPDVEHDATFPFSGGPNTVEAVRWAAYPGFTESLYFLHDVGMLELARPIFLDPSAYGRLPAAGQLDQLKTRRGLQDVTFTSVGYGLQQINPVFVQQQKIRMFAQPHLVQMNVPGRTGDFSLLLSNNHSTGGTCFGDSGGPNYLGDSTLLAGVTSFSTNRNCTGTGGVFRLDKQGVLQFVTGFMDS